MINSNKRKFLFLFELIIIIGCVSYDNHLADLVQSGDKEKLHELFIKDPNLPNKKIRMSIHGCCYIETYMLIIAIEQNNLELVEFLINNGANVNTPNKDLFKNYPLHLAVIYNQPELLKLLLNKGAFIDVTDWRKYTPFLEACYRGNYDLVVLLVEKGANIFLKDCDGNGALILAIKGKETWKTEHHNLIKLVYYLLSIGVDINQKNNYNRTALDCAIIQNDYELCKLLIHLGANSYDKERLEWIKKYCSPELVELLLMIK